MIRLAIYGTLRKGDYNYNRFLQGYEPLGEDKIKGFEMYVVNDSYPMITRGKGKIKVEVYSVPYELAKTISNMERGAGYSVEKVKTKYGEAYIFYFADNPRIRSGDWFKYLENEQPDRHAHIERRLERLEEVDTEKEESK